MSKELAQVNTDLNKIHAIGEFGVNELMAMKESIAKKLTVPQFNLFIYQMNRMGLDPSLGHGVPILYGSDVNIRIEYEGLKSLAQKSDGYKGIFAQAICENDDFEAETDEDGVISKIHFKQHKPPRGKVVGAYAVAKREGYKDFVVICDATEFDKYVKKNPSFWKLDNGSVDPDMAKKFAATRAVKGQFNIAMVVEDNMLSLNTAGSGVDALEPYNPEQRQDVTPTQTQGATVHQLPKREQRNVQEAQTEPVNEPQAVDQKQVEAARNMMVKNFELLGIEKKQRGAYIVRAFVVPKEQQETFVPSFEQMQQLNAMMEEEITNNLLLPEELE